jgi:cytochrome P450
VLGLSNFFAFRKDILGYTKQLATYGDVVRVKMGPTDAYFIYHPDHIYQVLVEQVERFPRSKTVKRVLGNMIGQGLLITDGSYWRKQRKLLQPAFHHKRIEAYGTEMVNLTAKLIEGWKPGEIRDISADMQRLALDIVSKTLFDTVDEGFAQRVHEVAVRLQDSSGRRLRTPIDLDWIPSPSNRQYFTDLKVLDDIIWEIINQHRKDNVDKGDFLSMLMNIRDENGEGMTDQQVRDEAITLFLAGHDTTALALAWAFYLLYTHPEVAQKLRAEVDRVLGDRLPTVADLPALQYTDWVFKEVMRLYPSAYFASREVAEETQMGGHTLKKGGQLFYLAYHIHRDTRFFPEPERFNPDRWDNNFEKSLPKCAYVPFSAGPHICIGNQFALMEGRLLLAMIAGRWNFERVPGPEIYPVPHITLYPSSAIQMRVQPR